VVDNEIKRNTESLQHRVTATPNHCETESLQHRITATPLNQFYELLFFL